MGASGTLERLARQVGSVAYSNVLCVCHRVMRLRLLPMSRPCTESFAAMPGDDKTRFCEKCGENVYDLSARTEAEALALYREPGVSKLCVRYAKGSNGGILFKAAAMAAMVSAAGCASHSSQPPPAAAHALDYDMGDGILDGQDRCPDDVANSGAAASAEGCFPQGDAGASAASVPGSDPDR